MALTPTHAQLHTERAARCVVADNGKHRERQLNKSLATQAKTKQCQQQCNMNMNGVRLCTAHTHTINRFTFVTTHKVQIQIVVSFSCLHFECCGCGCGCACCYSLLLCAVHIAPIWMLLPVPFGKSTSFGLVWAYLDPVVCTHCSYIYIRILWVRARTIVSHVHLYAQLYQTQKSISARNVFSHFIVIRLVSVFQRIFLAFILFQLTIFSLFSTFLLSFFFVCGQVNSWFEN